MRPMLIGHSQGGIQVVKVLNDLAGTYAPQVPGVESAHRPAPRPARRSSTR